MRIKKEVDIVLIIVFIALFFVVGSYIGIKEKASENKTDISLNSVWNSKYDNADTAILPIAEQPKEAIQEMPAEVSDEDYNFRIIEMKDTALNPRNLNISIGTTVFWVNQDPKRNYRIYEKSDNEKFNSGQIMPYKSFNYTFVEPGVYNYGDAIFKYMFGTITVE